MLQKTDLINYFHSSFTDPEYKGIGTEHEKFIFYTIDHKRLKFDGEVSVQKFISIFLIKRLAEK